MKITPKIKALLYNFVAFVSLFLLFRYALGFYIQDKALVRAILAAVAANVLAPKFGVLKTDKGEKLMMKWIFKKGLKELD